VTFETGALAPAVAGSMAIPGLLRAVQHEGRVLVDGALVEPLPYERLFERCDVVIACDVIGGPTAHGAAPGRFEPLLFSAQIMQAALLRERLARRAPHVLLRPPVDPFPALDFFAAARILRAAEACKDEWKRSIETALIDARRKTP
jgi:NTE family protein